jgi:hypothetical protein
MPKDWAYIRRERARRALSTCPECLGDGNDPQDDDDPCVCLTRAGDFSEPDPLADEGQSDARELARERY